MIIVLAGAVPGYWVSVATLDTLGRKTIQMGGFIILTILFIIMGFAYYHLSANGLLAIYVIAQFFFNFGPNVCSTPLPLPLPLPLHPAPAWATKNAKLRAQALTQSR